MTEGFIVYKPGQCIIVVMFDFFRLRIITTDSTSRCTYPYCPGRIFSNKADMIKNCLFNERGTTKLLGMFGIIRIALKGAGFTIHHVQSIIRGSNPKISTAVFEDCSHFIIDEAMRIVCVVHVANKFARRYVHLV